MRIAIDSAVFIYAFENTSELGDISRALFAKVGQGQVYAVASTLCLTEVLAKPARESGRMAFEAQMFMERIEHLDFWPVNSEIAIAASMFRGERNIDLADAMHVASALDAGADVFVTNDKALAKHKIPGLRIALLGEPLD